MAKSYPKQYSQKGTVFADGSGRNTVMLFSLFTSLLAFWLAVPNHDFSKWGGGGSSQLGVSTTSNEESPVVVSVAATPAVPTQEERRVLALSEFLGKRYRISQDAMAEFVSVAFAAGQVTRLDPLLLLAVMAVESGFNPIAESVMGAKGLMQIIPRHHADKFKADRGAEVDVLDPEVNILAGARILREYLGESGDLTAALRRYSGGVNDMENQYAMKVFGERERLEQFLKARSSKA